MESHNSPVALRLARIRESISEHELGGLLVNHLPNVRYLTGFTGSNGWLLVGPEVGVFFTDGRYEQQAEEELAGDANLELVIVRDGALDAIAESVSADLGASSLGFESRHLSFADAVALEQNAASVSWQPVKDLVETLREVKDERELAAIEKAVELAAAALQQTIELVEPGLRELDLASELDYRIRRLGADRPAFDTIVASGERTALPHASASPREVREGDLLLFDLGAMWQGYCSDLTRTYVVGEPLPRQREVYEAVRAAQLAALGSIREGVTGAEVDAAARNLFAEAGLEAHFTHSTGHGLGLEVHEAPRLHRSSDEALTAGMVVTVEPGLYFPGWGGVRIEDDALVTRGEPRLLADFERDRLLALSL